MGLCFVIKRADGQQPLTSIWSGGKKPRLPGKCFCRTFFCSSVSGILNKPTLTRLVQKQRKGSQMNAAIGADYASKGLEHVQGL